MENVSIYVLLEELEEEIELSPSKSFGKTKAVDPKIMAEIIGDIKNALDDELADAKKVTAEKDQIIARANAQAEAIVKDAQARANEMVQENNITRTAYEQAQKMLEKAKQRSLDIRKSANEYAEEVFKDLEEYYKESLGLLKENIAHLNAKKTVKEAPAQQQQQEQK